MLSDRLNLRGGPKMKCLLFSVVLIILPLQWKTSLVEAVEGGSDWPVEWRRIQEAAKREATSVSTSMDPPLRLTQEFFKRLIRKSKSSA
jgi:hypothetical protein